MDSYTDAIVSCGFSGGKINWTKTAINSVNASKDASKIVMQYASIYGVARFGNVWQGAVIQKSED